MKKEAVEFEKKEAVEEEKKEEMEVEKRKVEDGECGEGEMLDSVNVKLK